MVSGHLLGGGLLVHREIIQSDVFFLQIGLKLVNFYFLGHPFPRSLRNELVF